MNRLHDIIADAPILSQSANQTRRGSRTRPDPPPIRL